MQFKFRVLVLASIVASTFTIEAYASTVAYTQAPNQNLADSSAVWNNPADPGFTWTLDQDIQAWAYFKVGTNVSFNRIGWYGSNADGNFAVDLYSASCFSCSASWASTSGTFTNNLLQNTASYIQADIHKTLVSGNLYSYYIDLPSTLTLDHNSPYYALSVVNNYTASPFQWAASADGIGYHLHYIVGQAMFLNSPGNLAFTLTNTNVSAVPEPENYALILASLGLIGVMARWRRRTIL